MKRKKLPAPPVTSTELPGLDLEKVRSYQVTRFDEIGLQCVDYGQYCLLHPATSEVSRQLWQYLDVEDIRSWLEDQARESIRKAHRSNSFSAAAYPVGAIENGQFVVIGLRFSIYADGSERKTWRTFLAIEEGLDQIRKDMTQDIGDTAQKMNDITEQSGGGTN
jgi:hypothetical protein